MGMVEVFEGWLVETVGKGRDSAEWEAGMAG